MLCGNIYLAKGESGKDKYIDDEYLRKAILMLDLLDKRNELNKIIQKTRNKLRELKKTEREKLIKKFSPFTIFIITKRKDFVK